MKHFGVDMSTGLRNGFTEGFPNRVTTIDHAATGDVATSRAWVTDEADAAIGVVILLRVAFNRSADFPPRSVETAELAQGTPRLFLATASCAKSPIST